MRCCQRALHGPGRRASGSLAKAPNWCGPRGSWRSHCGPCWRLSWPVHCQPACCWSERHHPGPRQQVNWQRMRLRLSWQRPRERPRQRLSWQPAVCQRSLRRPGWGQSVLRQRRGKLRRHRQPGQPPSSGRLDKTTMPLQGGPRSHWPQAAGARAVRAELGAAPHHATATLSVPQAERFDARGPRTVLHKCQAEAGPCRSERHPPWIRQQLCWHRTRQRLS
jgi:hypothetical protein